MTTTPPNRPAVPARTPFARTELDALVRSLDAAGPHAPTLCEGWTSADLLAHLVKREHAPWQILTGEAEHRAVGHDARTAEGYDALLDVLSAGPPAWSPMSWAWETFDHLEYLVHHEDVRRAGGDWAPRALLPAQDKEVWRLLVQRARLLYRGAPVGIVLQVDGVSSSDAVVAGPRHQARPAPESADGRAALEVTISGRPVELTMHAHGRTAHARVTLGGPDEALAALAAAG